MPKHQNILLVDDNEINNLLHERLIEMSDFGSPVVVKQSAMEALDYLRSVSNNPAEAPEIIFLDIRMPVMDGFGFLDEFQKMPDSITKAKVILLSSTLDPEDNEKAKKYPHVVKMLLKPLTVDQLSSL